MKKTNTWLWVGTIASVVVVSIVCVVGAFFLYQYWDRKSGELKTAQDQAAQLQSDMASARSKIEGLNQESAEVQGDTTTLQDQLSALKDKLGKLQSDYDTLVSSEAQAVKDLKAATDSNAQAQIDLDSARAQAGPLAEKLKVAAAYIGLVDLIIGPLFEDNVETNMTPAMTRRLRSSAEQFLDVINDPVLRDKFEGMLDSGYNDSVEFDFYLYLLEAMEGAGD